MGTLEFTASGQHYAGPGTATGSPQGLNDAGDVNVEINGTLMHGEFNFTNFPTHEHIAFAGKVDSSGNVKGFARANPAIYTGDWQLAAPLKCLATSAATSPSQ
jgi:hypothetical protein